MDNDSAWLLTLPETCSDGKCRPVCTILAVQTVREQYELNPRHNDDSVLLTGSFYSLTLSWLEGDIQKQTAYQATCTTGLLDRQCCLELNEDHIVVDTQLQGRGLEMWILEQLVRWTRDKNIHSADEDISRSQFHYDSILHEAGICFKHTAGEGTDATLEVVSLQDGISTLTGKMTELTRLNSQLMNHQINQALRIRELEKRLWNTILVRGFFTVLVSSLTSVSWWLFHRIKGR